MPKQIDMFSKEDKITTPEPEKKKPKENTIDIFGCGRNFHGEKSMQEKSKKNIAAHKAFKQAALQQQMSKEKKPIFKGTPTHEDDLTDEDIKKILQKK